MQTSTGLWIVVILILLLLWYSWRGMERLTSQGMNSLRDCKSAAAMAAAKKYFDSESQYRGLFVMDPISGVNSGTNTCDIKYQNIALSTANLPAVDSRRFTYAGDTVVAMGRAQSGARNR